MDLEPFLFLRANLGPPSPPRVLNICIVSALTPKNGPFIRVSRELEVTRLLLIYVLLDSSVFFFSERKLAFLRLYESLATDETAKCVLQCRI